MGSHNSNVYVYLFPVDDACGHLCYYGETGDKIVFIRTLTHLEGQEMV